MSSNDELERMRNELTEKRVQLAARKGELRGRALERFEGMRTDPEMREALRVLAWVRHRPKGAPRRILEYDFEAGQIATVLPGWPKGVEPEQFIAEYVKGHRDAYLKDFDQQFDPSGKGGPAATIEEPETPSVVRLRDIVRGSGPAG